MKKIHLILFIGFLNMALFSCTPQTLSGNGIEACCGDGGNIPPPPKK